jgi:hypothetical protein
MTAPLNTGKQSVDMSAPAVRASRIRREPPPAAPVKLTIAERDEINQRVVIIGVLVFTAAIVVIAAALGSLTGWSSPSEYTLVL